MGERVIPPLPPGFVIDGGDVPPPPPGFSLDGNQKPVERRGVKNRFAPSEKVNPVVQNAVLGAAASIPDMFLNAPHNVYNLGKAAFGTGATMLGRSDLAPELTPTPNLVHGALQNAGAITPQGEPQTKGDEYLTAGLGGATAGAIGGLPGMAVGAIGNLVGQGVQDLTGSRTAALVANLLSSHGANKIGQYGRDAIAARRTPEIDTMGEVRNAGYVMPPSMTNPTMVNKIIESIGGKAATQQDASIRNQQTTNSLVRRDLGAPATMGITEDALRNLSNQRAQPYRDVAALPGLPAQPTMFVSPTGAFPRAPQLPADAMRDLNQARIDMKDHWREYQRQGSVAARDAYQSASARAIRLEHDLEQAANAAGRPELVQQMRQARTDIAKIHDVDRALNTDRGEVSAIDLSNARNRGVPLSGDLLTAAKMGNTFPKAVQRPENIGSPGVNNMNSMIGGGVGGTIGASMGGPVGAAIGGAAGAVATPYMQSLVRQMMLSKHYQDILGMPDSTARALATIPRTSANEALIRAIVQSEQGQQP